MNDDLLINPSAGSFTFSSQPSNVGQSAENRAVPNGKDSAAGLVLSENKSAPVSDSDLRSAVEVFRTVVDEVAPNSLSFSVDEVLKRMVVTVKAVASDEIIRQFPPEEFLTVAKYLASQEKAAMDEDFVKGLLYDTRM
jgi:uncharacterized FlaG/YvyC family protein